MIIKNQESLQLTGTVSEIKELVNKTPLTQICGASSSVLYAALSLAKYMPPRQTSNKKFGEIWTNIGLPSILPYVKRLAGEVVINEEMTVEIIRRLYMFRCTTFMDPVLVLLHYIPFPESTEGGNGDLRESAYWKLLTFVRTHQEIFYGLSFSGQADQSKMAIRKVKELAVDDLEYNGDYQAWELKVMAETIDFFMHRLSIFLTINQSGIIPRDESAIDFLKAFFEQGKIVSGEAEKKVLSAFTGTDAGLKQTPLEQILNNLKRGSGDE